MYMCVYIYMNIIVHIYIYTHISVGAKYYTTDIAEAKLRRRKCRWRSTMISEVLISGVQFYTYIYIYIHIYTHICMFMYM